MVAAQEAVDLAEKLVGKGADAASMRGSRGSTGFVTFNSLAAATAACQITLSHKAFFLQTTRAPEPRGLLWQARDITPNR